MPQLIPLFPLQLVVFPGTHLPLHIFEPRYKELVGESIANRTEFGIVLAQEQGIVNAGCTVQVESVITKYPDGRLDIMTIGMRRFDLVSLNRERAFLQGEVEFFADVDTDLVPASLRRSAIELFQSLVEAGEIKAYSEPDLEHPQLSFQLAQTVQDLDFQSLLLRDRSEGSRLRQVVTFLEQYAPRVRQVSRMKQLAPMNGFGSKPASL